MDVALQTKLIDATQGKWSGGQATYFKTMNGTPGTGVSSSTQQTFSANQALFEVENHAASPTAFDQGTGGTESETATYLILDYVKLLVVASDTAGTAIQYVGTLDPLVFRFSSGGFQPISPEIGPVNVLNMNKVTPAGIWHFGAVTVTSPSANRLIMARGCVKANAAAPIAVPNDEYYLSFGLGADAGAGSAKGGTAATIYRQNLGIVVVPPASSFVLNAWYPSITGAFTFELEAAWWELPCSVTTGAQ